MVVQKGSKIKINFSIHYKLVAWILVTFILYAGALLKNLPDQREKLSILPQIELIFAER